MKKRIIAALLAIVMFAMMFSAVQVWAAGDAPELISVSVAEGEISEQIESITLSFSSELDMNTLSGIIFTYADGTQIKGGAYVKEGATSSEAKVFFGALLGGEYTLKVTDDLKGANGTAAIPTVKNYSVSDSANDSEIFRLDLSGTEDGQYNWVGTESPVTGITFTNSGNASNIYEVKTENGKRFVRSYATEAQKATRMMVDLGEQKVSVGTVKIYAEYRTEDNTLQRNLVNFKKAYNGSQDALTLSVGGTRRLYRRDEVKSVMEDTEVYATLDENKFMKLCFEVSRSENTDNWSVKLYDEFSPTRVLLSSGEVNADYMSTLQQFDIYHTWTDTSSEVGRYIDIGDCYVEAYPVQKLVYNDSVIAPDAENINITLFRNESAGNIDATLTKTADGSEVTVNCELVDDRIVKITPVDYLSYGSEYTVSFTSGIVEDITINTEAIPVAVGTATASSGAVTVPLTVTGEAKDLIVMIMAKDASGKALGYKATIVTAVAGSNSATIDMSAYSASGYRVFVWEKGSGYSRNIVAPFDI